MSSPIMGGIVERPLDVSQRVFNKFTNKAGRQSLSNYVRGAYGDHFKKNARTAPGGEYGYEKPSDAYVRRKTRRVGHDIIGVYYGRTQRKAGQSRVTATAKRAKFILKPGHALIPWLRRGLETVAADDVETMVDDYASSVMSDIAAFRAKRQRIRVS